MRKSSVSGLVAVLCVLLALWVSSASGQAVFGSIFGTVTDPTGAAVAGANVTVTNLRKGTTDQATTNESGNYSVTHLIPDTYTDRIEGTGFKTVEQKDVIVSADASARVDGQFQVGSPSESFEGHGEEPQYKTH